jgi:nucleoside-diphosphate-sugar epimerase
LNISKKQDRITKLYSSIPFETLHQEMSTPIRNVLIAGASGSVGAPILSALLAEPLFTITILSRASSSATFPPNIHVIKISDAYTLPELTNAFTGQDAVVIALATNEATADGLTFRLIDAAAAAGVKRFIPSEYGANNLDPRARTLVPIYDAKGAMLEHLIAKAEASQGKFTYTSISCGSWLDWSLDPSKSGNFIGIDVKARTAVMYDSGNKKFGITTSANTGRAIAKALVMHEETRNKQVFLVDFMVTTREIIASLERQTGEKFDVEQRQSAEEIKALREKYDAGDYNAVYPLLAITFGADVDVAYDFVHEQEVWNEKLGLPKVGLDDVVKEAIELANRT